MSRLVPVRAWSLRTKLVVALVALVAVVCAVVGTATVVALRQLQLAQLDAQLVASAERARVTGSARGDHSPTDRCPASDGRRGRRGERDRLPPRPRPGPGHARRARRRRRVAAAASLVGFCAQTPSPSDTASLAALTGDGAPRTVDVGSLGTYRLVAVPSSDAVLVTGVPLSG